MLLKFYFKRPTHWYLFETVICFLIPICLSAQQLDTATINKDLAKIEDLLSSDKSQAKQLLDICLKNSQSMDYPKGVGLAYQYLASLSDSNQDSLGARKYFKLSHETFADADLYEDLAESYRKEGYMLSKMGDYDAAMEAYNKGLEVVKNKNADKPKAKLYSGMAGTMRLKGEYSASLEYGFKALAIQEKIGDQRGATFTYDRIGVVYKLLRNYTKALSYHFKSLHIREKLKSANDDDFGYSYMLIGDNYFELDSLNKAKDYFEKSLKSYQSANDNEGISYCFTHLGIVENALGNQINALNYYEKSKELFQETKNQRGLLNALGYMSNIYFDQKKYEQAEDNTLKALKIATDIQSESHIMNNQKMLYMIYRAQNNLQKALYYHELFSDSKDKLYNLEKSNEISDIVSKYEHGKANIENAKNQQLAEAKLKIKMHQLYYILAALLIGLLLIFYLFKINKQRKQINIGLRQINLKVEEQKLLLEEKQHELLIANTFLEQKVDERTYDLRQSKEQLEQYVYLASHDLKQPLRSISGFSQLLNMNLKSSQNLDLQAEEYLTYITSGVKYMDKLIEDIIDYSKINSGKADFIDNVSTAFIIKEALNNVGKQLEMEDVEIHNQTTDFMILTNAEKLIQVFEQILSNAIKFKKADVKSVITIRSMLEQNRIRFEIEDNGTGIKSEYIDRIFEPFLQLQGKHLHAGTGLGLSIVKRIIEQLGGNIYATSQEHIGTCFVIHLPVASIKPRQS